MISMIYAPLLWAITLYFSFGDLKMQASLAPTYENAFCNPTVLANQVFYEDTLVYALYTHKPVVEGHCLIIPKRPVIRFEELSDDETLQIAQTIKKVDQAVRQAYGTRDYFLLQKNGSDAGQTVPHVHFHYVPKKPGDSSSFILLIRAIAAQALGPISQKNMDEVRETLSYHMNN